MSHFAARGWPWILIGGFRMCISGNWPINALIGTEYKRCIEQIEGRSDLWTATPTSRLFETFVIDADASQYSSTHWVSIGIFDLSNVFTDIKLTSDPRLSYSGDIQLTLQYNLCHSGACWVYWAHRGCRNTAVRPSQNSNSSNLPESSRFISCCVLPPGHCLLWPATSSLIPVRYEQQNHF